MAQRSGETWAALRASHPKHSTAVFEDAVSMQSVKPLALELFKFHGLKLSHKAKTDLQPRELLWMNKAMRFALQGIHEIVALHDDETETTEPVPDGEQVAEKAEKIEGAKQLAQKAARRVLPNLTNTNTDADYVASTGGLGKLDAKIVEVFHEDPTVHAMADFMAKMNALETQYAEDE